MSGDEMGHKYENFCFSCKISCNYSIRKTIYTMVYTGGHEDKRSQR